MDLNLGIRLVIIFPTLLFLTGYVFKGIIERKNMEKIAEKENWYERRNDFFFIFGIESLFLFVANGLIITFELQETEIGVTSIIVGIILSMCLLVGIYAISTRAGVSATILGFVIIFGLLTGQLAYFSSYGTEKMIGSYAVEYIFSGIGFFVGVLISVFMVWLVLPRISKNKKSQNQDTRLISDPNKKEVSAKEESGL